MIADKNRIYDGWVSLENGVDGGRDPITLDPTMSESAENVSFRGGTPQSRPGIKVLIEQFSDVTHQLYCYNTPHTDHGKYHPVGAYQAEGTVMPDPPPAWFTGQGTQTIYKTGTFQCAVAYSPHHGEDCIMALIGGRLFRIIPTQPPTVPGTVVLSGVGAATVSEFRIEDTINDMDLRNRDDSPIAYMVQADKWMVAQDGLSAAILFDGVSARRAITNTTSDKTEVPLGTIMDYGMGRLVVVVNDRDIAFGDLYGSHPLPDPGDSIILFTERNFLTEGFDAAIPFDQGIATGASFFPQLDTSTGTGELLIFSERGASSFFLSLDRTLWKTSQFQVTALETTGLRGHRSVSVVNEDLWFRADDGVRSYRQARSEPSGWAHIPLSTNVRQFMDVDTPWLLRFISSIYFDNRVMFTCSPMWNQGRVIHGGLLVVDFDILSSFGGSPTAPQASKPAWEGHWTFPDGAMVMQVLTGQFNGVTRAFAFCLDNDGQNQLYEFTTDQVDDWADQPVIAEMVSRSFDFQKLSQESTPFTEVELYDADLWIKEIQ